MVTERETRRWLIGVVLLVVLTAYLQMACGHAGSISQASYELNHAIIEKTEQLHAAGTITDAEFRTASLAENKIAVAGSAFNKLAAAGTAKPLDARQLLQAIRQAVTQLKTIAPAPFKTVLDKLTEYDTLIANFMGPDLAAQVGGQ